ASFSPTSGPPGTEVTVTGGPFTAVSDVAVNGISSTMILVDSNSQLRFIVPVSASTGKISVSNPAGSAISLDDFIVTIPSGVVMYEESQNGGALDLSHVSTSNLMTAVSGNLYLAVISTKPFTSAIQVSGLDLTWTLVRSQCAGRNQTGAEIWMAQGNPTGNGIITADLSAAPRSTLLFVARYSGVDPSNPIGNLVSGNTNGVDGLCSGGADSKIYSFNLSTAVDGSVVFSAAAMRNKLHTPGADFTERTEIFFGSGGNTVGLAVQDKTVSPVATVAVDGSFNNNVDWAVIGLAIKPPTTMTKQTFENSQDEDYFTRSELPKEFQLFQNYPNPFNAETTISYALPEESLVRLNVFNLIGQRVRELLHRKQPAGLHKIQWDGRDENGTFVSSGIYLIKLQSGAHKFTSRLILQK
ncbi:MAG: FlgD immunoglobulin-like domain containing protein, partial [bacterium]